MIRIFIASKINDSPEIRNIISNFREELSDEKIRWVEPFNLHLTYKFLGDTDEHFIPEISNKLNEITGNFKPFKLEIKSVGVFKSIQSPMVLWLGIAMNSKLEELYGLINQKVNEPEIRFEMPKIKPHLTIGRLKKLNTVEKLKSLLNTYHDKIIDTQKIEEIVLFESQLFRNGPVYKPIVTCKFKHDAP